MTKKCSICTSAQREAIDSRLACGGRPNSLRRIAADAGFSLRAVWNHSRYHTQNESAGAAAQLRRLLSDWRRLHAKALRDGNLDAAARALQAIAELQMRIAPTTGNQAGEQPGRADSIGGSRSALGHRESQSWCKLVFDDPVTGRPIQDAREFAAVFLRLHGWRDLLSACLETMLMDKGTPERVKQGTRELLTVLVEKDTNDTLGEIAFNRDEGGAEEGDGES